MAEKEETPAVAGGGGMSRLLIVGLLVGIISAAAAAGGVYFIVSSQGQPAPEGEGEEAAEVVEKPSGPPIYHEIDPPFVVNLAGDSSIRFLQATIEVMARDDAIIEAMDKHKPLLRNNLLMLLSSASLEEIGTREGKEALRQAALEEVRAVLKSEGEPSQVEELYFTAFVVQ